MNELSQLQSSLAHIFRETLPVSANFENTDAVKMLQKIIKALDGVNALPPSESIVNAIEKYRITGNLILFQDIKYVCYGAVLSTKDGWSLLGDSSLRAQLFDEIKRLSAARQLKCFQALLSSYFSFARFDDKITMATQEGWEALRDWLAQNQKRLQRAGENGSRLPSWFGVLTKHSNLLTSTPCDRYGEDMLRGDNFRIEEARQGLRILGDSWVMQEAILSQMKVAVALGDDLFKMRLDALLGLVLGKTEVKVSDLLKRLAIALIISRYARCASKPEHPVLRDAVVSIIGNPWLKRKFWDVWVRKHDEQPDDEAREMINGWLVRCWITDFFELLSEDGQTNQRRLNYWLRFVPAIKDLWFVVGSNAQQKLKNDARYLEVKKRADGRWLKLIEESNIANNAFIMKIGNYLMVEFGLTNNACFIYSSLPEPFSLARNGISESNLKIYNKNGIGEKFSHNSNWEARFDKAIFSKISYRPGKDIPKMRLQAEQPRGVYTVSSDSARSAATNKGFNETEFWNFIKQYSLSTEDKRNKGGALWVCTEQSRYPTIDQWLEGLGFKYKPGRGWWRE